MLYFLDWLPYLPFLPPMALSYVDCCWFITTSYLTAIPAKGYLQWRYKYKKKHFDKFLNKIIHRIVNKFSTKKNGYKYNSSVWSNWSFGEQSAPPSFYRHLKLKQGYLPCSAHVSMAHKWAVQITNDFILLLGNLFYSDELVLAPTR